MVFHNRVVLVRADDKIYLLDNCLLHRLCIFTLQFPKLEQKLFKFERYEVFESNYDKNPSEGRTVVTPHAVAMLGTA